MNFCVTRRDDACLLPTKSCPHEMGKVAWRSHDERGTARSCQAILLFPLSFAYAQQLPRKRWSLLVRLTSSNIKPALEWEVDASETSRRRGCIEAALVCVNPSVNPPCGVLPAPRPGSLLVRRTNSHIKPALKGEVDFAKQKTEGVSLHPTALSSATPCAHSSRTSALWR